MAMSSLVRIVIASVLFAPCLAIYEDQVGQVDWKQDHVGVPTSSLYFSKHVYVATDQGVLASIDARSGDIEWRHLMAKGARGEVPIEHLAFSGVSSHGALSDTPTRDLLTVTKGGSSEGRRLQMWRADGALLWDETTLPMSSTGESHLVLGTNYISLLAESTLNILSTSGRMLWQISDLDFMEVTGGDNLVLTDIFEIEDNGETKVAVVGQTDGQNLVVLFCEVKTQKVTLGKTVRLSRKISKDSSVFLFKSSVGKERYVATIIDQVVHAVPIEGSGSIVQMDLSSMIAQQKTVIRTEMKLSDSQQVVAHQPIIVKDSDSRVLSVEFSVSGSSQKSFAAITMEAASNAPSLVLQSAHAISATSVKDKVFVAKIQHSALEEAKEKSSKALLSLVEAAGANGDTMGGEVECDASTYGSATRVFPFITEKRGDGELFFRLLAVTSGDAFSLLQPGKSNWVRDEALTSVTHVVFTGQRNSEEEKGSGGGDIEFVGELSDFKARWNHQLARLSSSVTLIEPKGKDGLTRSMRHKFGFDKDAICLTKAGRLINLNLENGKVNWSKFVPGSNGAGLVRLLISRAHPHGALNAEVVLLQEQADSTTIAYFVDAAHGTVTGTKQLPFSIASVTTIGNADHQGRSHLLLIGQSSENTDPFACSLVDATSSAPTKTVMNSYFHAMDEVSSTLRSYQVTTKHPTIDGCFLAEEVGSANLGGQVLAVTYPSSQDPVNAPAQILGDDSLLLKYTNNHLMALMSESSGDGLAVSLIDTVSGKLLHRVVHANAQVAAPGSMNMKSKQGSLIISENMVVYSFWNVKAKRCEIGVLSLYEGMVGAYDMNPFKIPLQDPSFSSFNAKPPVVMQRTFISPRSIKHLSATVTNQGISTKNVLAVCEGGQIAMLPRRMLDPRRPNAPPSKVEMEEGLFQYHPHLFMDPRGYVTMNQTALGVDHVYVSPAIIESATMVLATGIDTFFTRATPSKTFDLLAADFNHSFLLALLFGLLIATFVLRKFDQDKKLNAAWR